MPNFEEHIDRYFASLKDCELTKAMKYAMEGGKRIRPRITFALLEDMGIDIEKGFDASLALEMIQTYSLIHDDLPAMDNDDMRRGKPSLHKAFREDIAILAGDQLLTGSFGVIASSSAYDPLCRNKMIDYLSRFAGLDGMVYGQLLDVTTDCNKIDEDMLFEIEDNKTGGLFKIACLNAMCINNEENEEFYIGLGSRIGRIFQMQDDLIDVLRSEKETGKSSSDLANEKGTALSLHSVNDLQEIIAKEFDALDAYLKDASFNAFAIKKLLEQMSRR